MVASGTRAPWALPSGLWSPQWAQTSPMPMPVDVGCLVQARLLISSIGVSTSLGEWIPHGWVRGGRILPADVDINDEEGSATPC